MAENPSSPEVEPQQTPADTGEGGGEGGSGSPDTPTPGGGSEPAASVDSVYESAFQETLAPEVAPEQATSPSPSSDNAGGGTEGGSEGSGDGSGGPELSDDDRQLLKRWHLSPEDVAGWDANRRAEFIQNARKREQDQQAEYNRMQQRVRELEGTESTDPEGTGQAPQQQQDGPGTEAGKEGQPPTNQTIQQARQQTTEAMQRLRDNFGDEIGDVQQAVEPLMGVVEKQQQALERAENVQRSFANMFADQLIEIGVGGLESDYPSLSKPEARQKVVDRMHKDWANSPHAKANGPLFTRIQSALKDAAKAEFGNQTEAAAQASLQGKSKDRLAAQPGTGKGKGNPQPRTVDDVYDQAFHETLQPQLHE